MHTHKRGLLNPIIRTTDEPTFAVVGTLLQFVSTPDQNSGSLSVIRGGIPPRAVIALHSHPDAEISYLTEELMEVFQDDGISSGWQSRLSRARPHPSGFHANPIGVGGVTSPAPAAVYQSAHVGNFTYTIPGFAPGSSQTVRLHFAETFFNTTGSQTFNVSINGTQVLTNFDIFAAAGAQNKAVVEQFTQSANSRGQYVIQFTSVINQALVSGIEITSGAPCTAPPAPSGNHGAIGIDPDA